MPTQGGGGGLCKGGFSFPSSFCHTFCITSLNPLLSYLCNDHPYRWIKTELSRFQLSPFTSFLSYLLLSHLHHLLLLSSFFKTSWLLSTLQCLAPLLTWSYHLAPNARSIIQGFPCTPKEFHPGDRNCNVCQNIRTLSTHNTVNLKKDEFMH